MKNELIQPEDESTQAAVSEPKPKPDHMFEININNATYVIGMFFKKDARTSLEDRLKRMICNDVLAGNF